MGATLVSGFDLEPPIALTPGLPSFVSFSEFIAKHDWTNTA